MPPLRCRGTYPNEFTDWPKGNALLLSLFNVTGLGSILLNNSRVLVPQLDVSHPSVDGDHSRCQLLPLGLTIG